MKPRSTLRLDLWSPLDDVKFDGLVVGEANVPKTAPSIFSFNDGFDIGSDAGWPVSDAYLEVAPFAFNAETESLKVRYTQ